MADAHLAHAIGPMRHNQRFRGDMTDSEKTEAEILQQWIESVGGSVSPGESLLKSVEVSKKGDKLTIVLKKKKPKKEAG